ncbi:MAG: sigma 54-interacting transcriptional regulator [Gracilimonas sp.]|uniref:sigma 54-interacting transcriptional regulator n=1 Tax=Gracilimonas TaxID=649462 RepID=UPI001B071D3B|nr:sigma 54-interacting transcriptional regulator [Gracilimonas sp.]MBO6585837.1 sigma 54-interacting transcriptional regulator [Gracilimonas sp.]MBO6616834.1 sigma 54-interacting transcriptional regulator [Gracilimonas sp.]
MKASTLGELKESGWESISVKEEIRKNLIQKMRSGEELFPGILGYDKTVIPQVQHALLSRHDMILLGLRGQAKTRMLRLLVNFLDEYIPIVKGSEINDDPLNPLSKYAKELVEEKGDDTPIDWLHRSYRYGEKLATPDTTVADLIGDIDPIKAATKKLTLADQNVINFGLIPRTNRGIFVINELPDLQPRIQVALLNIMQERDIQIRGFNVRIPLDVSMAFSANPEDYTNRGNIITPLKDRIDSQIITHYPKELGVGINITRQEAWQERESGIKIHIPDLYREVIEKAAFEARESEYVDQKSGVSTRMTITALEQVVSSAERRAILNNEKETTVRIADLYHMVPALTGKIELVYEGEQEGAISVAKHILGKAVSKMFKSHFPDPQSKAEDKKSTYKEIMDWFADGNEISISDTLSNKEYETSLNRVEGLKELVQSQVPDAGSSETLIWMDFVLEALHQNSMLSKQDLDDQTLYTDMLGSMFSSLGDIDEEGYDEFE